MSNYDQIIADAAAAYNSDPGVLYGIAKLESGFRPRMNNWDSNAKKGTPSGGLMQFIQPTYSAFSRQAKAANPGAWKGVRDHWLDDKAQALTTAWAIKNGKGSHWATYGRAQAYKGKGPKNTPNQIPQGMDQAQASPAEAQGTVDTVDPIIAAIFARRGRSSLLAQDLATTKTAAPAPLKMPTLKGGAGGSIGAGAPTGKVANSWKELQRIGMTKFGLRNDAGSSQTTGGRHTAGSEHYSGRAIDFGTAKNSKAQLQSWLKWARSQGYDALDEHDHIHVSLPGSGI
jgi:hypothetical protein